MDRVSSGDGRSRLETLVVTARRFMGTFRGRGVLREAKTPSDKENKYLVRLQISTR